MRKNTLIALMMIAVMLLTTACSLVVKDETADGKRIIVDVAGRTVDKSTFLAAVSNVQDQNEYYAYMYQMYGLSNETYDREADYANVVASTLDSYVSRFVQLNKAEALGLNAYTEEDNAAIDQKAQESYDSYLSECQSYYFADTTLEGDELTAALTAKLTELGITMDVCRSDAEQTYLLEKLEADAVKDVAVTEEEIVAAFDTSLSGAYATRMGVLVQLDTDNTPALDVLAADVLAQLDTDAQAKLSERAAAGDTAATLDTVKAELAAPALQKHLIETIWGIAPFTAEEEAALDAQAQTRLNAYIASLKDAYQLDDAAAAAKAETLGITLSACRSEEVNAALIARMTEMNAAYVSPEATDDPMVAQHDARVSALNAYNSALATYGSSYNTGSTVYFAPDGYRYVKQILIAPVADESGELAAANTAKNEATNAMSTLSSAMTTLTGELEAINTEISNYQAAITENEEDIADPENEYTEENIANLQKSIDTLKEQSADAQARADAKNAEIAAKQAEIDAQKIVVDEKTAAYNTLNDVAFAAALTIAQEAQAKLAAGESIDTLIAEYGTDARLKSEPLMTTGYALCAGSTTLNATVVSAAMALTEIGTASEPVRTTAGWHIAYYAGDVPTGFITLESQRADIETDVLTTKKSEAYNAQVTAWTDEAQTAGQVNTYLDRLN